MASGGKIIEFPIYGVAADPHVRRVLELMVSVPEPLRVPVLSIALGFVAEAHGVAAVPLKELFEAGRAIARGVGK